MDDIVNAFIETKNKDVRATLDAKMAESKILLDDLEVQFAQIELERGLKITKKDIITFIKTFTSGHELDKDFQNRIIKNLVNVVYIYDDKIVMYFNIKSGKEIAYIGKADTDSELEELKCSNSNDTGVEGGI